MLLENIAARHRAAPGQIALPYPHQIAEVYSWRGDQDRAFEWWQRGYDHHDGGLFQIKIDGLLAGLRDDPRFSELLRKMNLLL